MEIKAHFSALMLGGFIQYSLLRYYYKVYRIYIRCTCRYYPKVNYRKTPDDSNGCSHNTYTTSLSLPHTTPLSPSHYITLSLTLHHTLSLTLHHSLPHTTSHSLPHTTSHSLPHTTSHSLPHTTSHSLPHTTPLSLPHTTSHSLYFPLTDSSAGFSEPSPRAHSRHC